jgi:hypothetical protein
LHLLSAAAARGNDGTVFDLMVAMAEADLKIDAVGGRSQGFEPPVEEQGDAVGLRNPTCHAPCRIEVVM